MAIIDRNAPPTFFQTAEGHAISRAIADKVRAEHSKLGKIDALAKDSGATPGEAAAARAMARKIRKGTENE
jgi:hypothetical protein